MARYKVIPTKTNLIRLKRDLSFTQEGYELLEQKRQILVVELMGIMDKAADAQELVEKKLAEAYHSLENAILAMGRQRVAQIAPAVNIEPKISLSMRRIMGVNIPKVEVEVKDKAPYYSLGESSFWVDDAVSQFKGLLVDLGNLSELRISLMRIAQEVQKTMRRVNALDKIAIPDFKESIKYIEESIEESERETFALLKIIKERLK